MVRPWIIILQFMTSFSFFIISFSDFMANDMLGVWYFIYFLKNNFMKNILVII